MDGENAWEYYNNDGQDFLNLLYQRLSETEYIKTTTVAEYLKKFPAEHEIEHLAAGSWIYGEFGKWIGNPLKIRAWEYLVSAREELTNLKKQLAPEKLQLAWKQMRVLEGSDWFWWYGDDDTGDFDKLYRMHLANFYTILGKEIPDYVKHPIA
jgi:alpha-amylase/alpha-mannosidase (GH57 family)